MSFCPHTPEDIQAMLAQLKVERITDLFDEIPQGLRQAVTHTLPDPVSEMDLGRMMRERAALDKPLLCFAGAGAYQHYIPAAVWDIASRGEFMTAYTPYQAEASQGTLQLIYEYQTMMSRLLAMDVSNASLYDGASALAESCLMAVRAQKKGVPARILIPETVNPRYREVLHTLCHALGLTFEILPFDAKTGTVAEKTWDAALKDPCAAVVLPYPNYFGHFEDVHAVCDKAHQQGAFVIALVNPLLMTVLSPPGEWGETGADIACGEGQPLGIPLAGGGPYFGFITCKQALIRQMPGRIVGRTHDTHGREGYTLTLQAREQHIRRAKATSNICTNQGLMVTAATVFMAIMGDVGLSQMAQQSMARTQSLVKALTAIPGVKLAFGAVSAHEAVLICEQPVRPLIEQLCQQGILAGVDLSFDYPSLGHALLVCCTEMTSEEDIQRYAQALKGLLKTATSSTAKATVI